MKKAPTWVVFNSLLLFLAGFFLFHPSQGFGADSDIVINEFQIDPSGASQWIELYNKGDSSIDLTGWILDDDKGSENFTLPSVILSPKHCVVFQSSKFNLDITTNDTVRLFHNAELIDSYSYSQNPGSGASFGRSPDGSTNWILFTTPTREKLNADGTVCAEPSPPPTAFPTATQEPTMLTSTPTPTKTPTPTRTLLPTSTEKPFLLSPTTPLPSPTIQEDKVFIQSTYPTPVLGIRDKSSLPTPKNDQDDVLVKASSTSEVSPLTLLFCGVGGILLLVCGILVFQKYRRGGFTKYHL